MFRACCVPKCNSRRQDVKFHRFPKNKVSRDKWLHFIECNKLKKIGNMVNKDVFVCHNHFESKFVKASTNRLRMGAYPTLFTDAEIASGRPSVEEPSFNRNEHSYAKKCPLSDHTYCASSSNITSKMLEDANWASEEKPITIDDTINDINENPASMNAAVIDSSEAIPGTPQRYSKKRLVRDVKSLTPKCRLLYKEFKKARQQRDFMSRAKKALDFTKEKSFAKLTKDMNPLAKKILWMQIKLSTKGKSARRFSTEEKLIGLAVYKQSPKCYKFLQKIFILPSKTTLKKMISNLDIDVGINPQIFELIKEEVKHWNDQKKLCSIIFDEMAIEPAVNYLSQKDEIDGFVHLNKKTNQFADEALVFMIRGAVHKWQQPIAFYFSEGQTKSIQLKAIIKDIITAVTETGLRPIALISDQGTSFQSALNELLEETKREQLCAGKTVDDTIHLCGNKLNIIYDPPHLIKGIRNNLLTKDVLYEGKRATWQDIIDVYNVDCGHGESRIMHKLTDEHVIPGKIKKMKVKTCVRVISKTVAAALSYTAQFPLYPDGTPVSSTLKNTAEFLSFMDDLFDSANGATVKGSKDLRRPVTINSSHHNFWTEAIKKLKNLKFITKENKQKSVPSLKNWIVTLKSLKSIWYRLNKKENVKIMRPRYFNSDPIENFFGQVRAYNCRSNDPSASAFKNTFKSLLITRFIKFHSQTYNCEDDLSKDILSIDTLFKKITKNEPEAQVESYQTDAGDKHEHEQHEDLITQIRCERLRVHSKAYTVGWVTRKILKKIKCRKCKSNLLTLDNNNLYTWIQCKEYKSKNTRKLCYPTEGAVRFFGSIVNATNKFLEYHANEKRLSDEIKKKVLKEHPVDFMNCESHKNIVKECFLNITIRLMIFNWCTVINKILRGVDIIRLERSSPSPMQKKALLKYKKKLKNKKLNK